MVARDIEDIFRSESRRVHGASAVGADGPENWTGEDLGDDQLRLIFTCCHRSVPIDGRITLSLREVCGLTTEEIASAYLVSIETMKKRISRVGGAAARASLSRAKARRT